MNTEQQITEAQAVARDEMPGFFDRAAQPLQARKTDRYGNPVRKGMFTPAQQRALDAQVRADTQDSATEVRKLMSIKKTAEIDAMGFDPANQSKEKDVVILVKRVVLGKPEFILKTNKKQVTPEISSLGGVTWSYTNNPMRKVVVNAVNSIRLTESTELVEKIVKRDDGKYEVVSKDGSKSFGTYGSEAAALKRLRQIEFFKHVKG